MDTKTRSCALRERCAAGQYILLEQGEVRGLCFDEIPAGWYARVDGRIERENAAVNAISLKNNEVEKC